MLGLYDGATTLINRAHTRSDALNLTNIFDNVTPANNAALWYSPANRLQNADGAWGSETFYYDGVGNRIEQRTTPPGGSETIATLGYPATSNRVTQITQNATTVRSIGYDAAGNITSDSRLGSLYAYTYNHANRLKTVSYEGNLKGTYTYNGLSQLITRVVTNSGSLDGTTHYVHDRSGNVIAELDASGATAREYIWLPEAEIAPTAASRATIDRPVAVVDGVNATPVTYYVHADHLHRPIRMSNAAKAIVWSAEYQPWGAVQSLSGALTLDLRFPGQWFQLEAGLHYNWHRHYDASLGRYTQPDPLSLQHNAREPKLPGFQDGPSLFSFAKNQPSSRTDPRGLMTLPEWTTCVMLDAATSLICKPIVPLTNRCRWWLDDCPSILRKIDRINLCISLQSRLTQKCFPKNSSHYQRLTDELNARHECELLYSEKKCGQCSAP